MEPRKVREGILFGIGSPLLDISVNTDATFLERYGLQANNAILANEEHQSMYADLVTNHEVDYIAGGATLNSIRVAQWLIQKPLATLFAGCIGKDKFGEILETKTKEAGVDGRYQIHEQKPTGTCAVVVTRNGLCRSLCAYLAASGSFTKDHLDLAQNQRAIENALYYYIAGYFLTVSMDSILLVAEHASQENKTFAMNLSSPYISQVYMNRLMTVLPYVDILFGNETEAETFAKEQGFEIDDIKEIALQISGLPKANKRSRMVIITQGENPVIVAQDGHVQEYPVCWIPTDKIIDTNGAGDAFVGGFLAKLVEGRPINVCVQCGIYAASEIIQRSGCAFPETPNFKSWSNNHFKDFQSALRNRSTSIPTKGKD